jgi:Short C-terminal domain
MISRRRGRPGLLGTVARTAVIAGTAQTTANAINRRSEQRAAAPSPDEGDLVAQLSRLAQLRDSGALTESEFQSAKTRILG